MDKLLAQRQSVRTSRPLILRYGVAVLAVIATTAVRGLISPYTHENGIFVFFVLPVILAGYYGGLGPGLLATCLGAAAGVYFFIHPTSSLQLVETGDYIRTLAYVLIGVCISVLTENLHRSREVLEHSSLALARSEAELREREEDFRFTLQGGRMGSWEWDIRTGAIRWSDNLEELHGLKPGSFGGTLEAFTGLIHPDDREAVTGAIQGALESGDAYDIEFRVPWPDGSVHWMRGMGRVIRDGRGQPLRMIGLGIDITPQKEAEEAAQHLAAIVQSSSDAIIGKMLDGTITSWNVGAERLYGYTAAEAIGRPIEMLTPPERLDDVRQVMQTIASGQRVDSTETVRVAKDGRRIDVSLTVSPVLDREGRITGASAISRDITDRKRLEAELRNKNEQLQTQAEELAAQYEEMQLQNAELAEQDRQRNEFLAMLSHELRNPLAPIAASSEILRARSSGDPAVARHAAIIDRQVRHLARIVDDLLDVSRITQGKVLLQKEPVDLAAVVEQAVQICHALIQERQHDFSTCFPREPVLLEADPTRLVQIICNLLNNAAKYTEPGGRIRLSVERFGDRAVLRVSDTGRGIDAAVLPHIFDLFVQGERTLARTEGGLGIGLTLVRRLVELHGGTVEARSAGPGQGSEFIVRLPALDQHGGTVRASAPTAAPRLRPEDTRVLLVDDNRDSNESLGELISMWGYQVWTAVDASGALRLAAEHRPHAILLDIGLPDLSGYEVVKRLRAQPDINGTLIVAVSGYGQPADRRKSLDAGFDQHVVKPVDALTLRDLLEQAASRAPAP